jgi:nucleoside triphosphate pyrophosphatase
LALILASSSAIRRQMLRAAGVEHDTIGSAVDEDSLKAGHSDPAELTSVLAAAKAQSVNRASPEAWAIGSDSVVSVEGRLFDKPASRDEAARHLRLFSGKAMQLTSAVALARRGELDWSHVDTATLHVRPLTDAFIQAYLDVEWPDVGYCVGVFRMEGPGVQLFERVEGDHFTILGMPLIPLLGALRERGLLLA